MSLIDNASSTKGKILIIDDESEVREVLRLHLESANYNVIEATDGEEGVNMMKSGSNLLQVGMIICDIRMPKVNGIEAIDFLKKNAPSIPIIVVTGYPDSDLAVSLLKKGVKDYMVKPIEKAKLLEKVAEVLAAPQDFNYV
ncbi:MAG: response regulator [Nitrospina sp.]|jgi:two-component system, chemotaxis family, chemotaxis protein CheY|nr:response regulator [Nitrospina sp.]MBT3509082.1 response regulator [Nitrospina sp.]MBT3876736.1 response regulator [Nitrospina sp.]MBT4047863.1 response regulator [Nitrospina sp.]MBT4558576.1 response regulator [Nitrospina sp.]